MTKPTVTDSQLKYGLFRADAESFAEEHCLRNIVYSDINEAQSALVKMRSEVPVAERNLIIMHQVV